MTEAQERRARAAYDAYRVVGAPDRWPCMGHVERTVWLVVADAVVGALNWDVESLAPVIHATQALYANGSTPWDGLSEDNKDTLRRSARKVMAAIRGLQVCKLTAVQNPAVSYSTGTVEAEYVRPDGTTILKTYSLRDLLPPTIEE